MQTDCYPDAIIDWPKSLITKLAEVNPRYKIEKGHDYPFIEMAAVGENFTGFLSIGSRKFDSSGLSRFKVNDTLFAKITPCVENGKIAFVDNLPSEIGLGSTEFIVLSPKSDTSPRFLYHLVCAYDVRGRAAARMEGSTGRQRVPDDVFTKNLLIPVPQPNEQRIIANYIDSIDIELKQCYEATVKAEILRKGLIQASFEFDKNKEERKYTEAGMIPSSWDAIKGKKAFTIIPGGCSSLDEIKRLREGEIADAWFMKVEDYNTPRNLRAITYTDNGFKSSENRKFKLIPVGTIIIAKRGAAIYKNRVRLNCIPLALDPNLMAIQTLPGILPDFLKYQLEWRNLSRYLEDSGIPQLNNKDLYPRYFLRAPIEQQIKIIEQITVAEAYQDALISKCNSLEVLKKSLAYDLFRGKVRIMNIREMG